VAGQAQRHPAGLSAPNAFAGARLDRAGSARRDPGWLRAQREDPAARAVVATAAGVYLRAGAPALVPLDDRDPEVLLGLDAAGPVFAVDGGAPPPDAELVGLREAAARLAQADGGLVAYAAALLNWHRTHPHCSVCGAPTRVEEGGLLRACPRCGAQHHPRTDPVVIVLVTDGERTLLGRQASWPPRRVSCLAGFVEPGESLEDAVVREVAEEAGVTVRDARYVSSQPWPFPSSLMLGFRAAWVAGEPVPADEELEEVRWFTRAQLRAERDVLLPPRLAIARRLIDAWVAERS